MVQRRSKTDKLDSQLLANLLRINQIPLAYVPPWLRWILVEAAMQATRKDLR